MLNLELSGKTEYLDYKNNILQLKDMNTKTREASVTQITVN